MPGCDVVHFFRNQKKIWERQGVVGLWGVWGSSGFWGGQGVQGHSPPRWTHGDHTSLTKASLDGAGREGKGRKERKGLGRWKEGEMQGEGGREKKMEKGRKRDEKGGRGRKSLLLLGQFLGTWDLGLSFDLPKAAQDLPYLKKQSSRWC